MIRPAWVPEWIDLERPNEGRVWDCYLGGAYNFGPDRELARKSLEIWPDLREGVRAQRVFLRRVVRFLISAGVKQFIDLGAGLPTSGNVYNVAREADPGIRVACVDIDPVTVAHSQLMLADDEMAAAFQADLRQPAQVMAHDEVRRLIDPRQPVAIMLLSVLHFVRDEDDPAGIVAWLRDTIPPGSYIAIVHATNEGRPQTAAIQSLFARSGAMIRYRSRAEVERMVAGLDLFGPGLVSTSLWPRPEPAEPADGPAPVGGLAALGHTR